MFAFESTRLWSETLAEQSGSDQHASQRTRLRVAYLSLRERAALLADRIQDDLPELTVHDVTHLDALWELADLVAGSNVSLNPAEGFVLGAAFLIHDLGLAVAAYPV